MPHETPTPHPLLRIYPIGNLVPGAKIILFEKHGGPNQQFMFRGKEARK